MMDVEDEDKADGNAEEVQVIDDGRWMMMTMTMMMMMMMTMTMAKRQTPVAGQLNQERKRLKKHLVKSSYTYGHGHLRTSSTSGKKDRDDDHDKDLLNEGLQHTWSLSSKAWLINFVPQLSSPAMEAATFTPLGVVQHGVVSKPSHFPPAIWAKVVRTWMPLDSLMHCTISFWIISYHGHPPRCPQWKSTGGGCTASMTFPDSLAV